MRGCISILHFLVFALSASGQDFIKDYSCRRIETDAKFEADTSAWNKYLQGNINSNICQLNCAPVGIYKVEIQFMIDKNGNIGKIASLTKHGYGMEEEIIRVVSSSPKWTPATSNGRVVISFRRQSFTFYNSGKFL